MRSVAELLAAEQPHSATVAQLARSRDVAAPYSVRDLESRHFHQNFGAASGIPLGFTVDCTVTRAGHITWSGEVRNTGYVDYDFYVDMRLFRPGGNLSVGWSHTGTSPGQVKGGPRITRWAGDGHNESLGDFWDELDGARLQTVANASLTGLLPELAEIGLSVVEFAMVASAAGAPVAASLLFGRELEQALGVRLVNPYWSKGVILTAGAVALLGPTILIPAWVAGRLVDELDDLKLRPLSADEHAVAHAVFERSLAYDQVRICNATNPNPRKDPTRAFTFLMVDGLKLIGVGPGRYPDMAGSRENRRTLVHELTHAWQCEHHFGGLNLRSTVHGLESNEADQRDYAVDFDAHVPWDDLHPEAQAEAVASWFDLFHDNGGLDSGRALKHPLYRYISENIRSAFSH